MWKDCKMKALSDAGEARLLAYEGGHQLALALAAGVRRLVRQALSMLGRRRDVAWEA